MKRILVVMFSLVVFVSGAVAQSADDVCKKREYAELKDMQVKELRRTYCLYTGLADVQHDGFRDMIQFGADKAEPYRLQSAQCNDEADRVLNVLKKKQGTAYTYPACKGSVLVK